MDFQSDFSLEQDQDDLCIFVPFPKKINFTLHCASEEIPAPSPVACLKLGTLWVQGKDRKGRKGEEQRPYFEFLLCFTFLSEFAFFQDMI